MENNELLSVAEVAKILKISQQQVRNILRDKKISSNRVGKQWIIPRSEVENYILNNDFVIEPDDYKRESNSIPDIVGLSFFSGAMGLDIGMEKGGIKPVLACEIDKSCRKTIYANKKDIGLIGDIRKYSVTDILDYANIPHNRQVDVIYGGPPCQAFSTAGKRKGFEDDRGNIFMDYINLIGKIKPRYAVIENVRGLFYAKHPLKEIEGEEVKGSALYYVIKKLRAFGYSVSFNLYNSANFGAPQSRDRVILICKLGDNKVDYLSPTHSKNGEFGLPKWKTFGDAVKNLNIDTHNHIEFPEKRKKYFELIEEGGNWRSLTEELQKEALGKSYYLGGGKTGFLRRLSFDKPSPTLVTHPAMPATDLCHPVELRPLSVEEYSRVQGFPDNWKFYGNILDQYKQIGNAVPIKLGEAVARTILADMNNESLPSFEGFKFSAYNNTRDDLWELNFLSIINKISKQPKIEQLSLI